MNNGRTPTKTRGTHFWTTPVCVFVGVFFATFGMNVFSAYWSFASLPTDRFTPNPVPFPGFVDSARPVVTIIAMLLEPLWILSQKLFGQSDSAMMFLPPAVAAITTALFVLAARRAFSFHVSNVSPNA